MTRRLTMTGALGPTLARLGLAGLCMVAILSPRQDTGRPQVLMVLAGAGVTAASAEAAWTSVVARLDGDAGLTLVRFGGDAAVEWRDRPARDLPVRPPAEQRVDARDRRAGAAVEASLALLAPGRPAAVVLATDMVTDPEVLDRVLDSLGNAGIPVHAVPLRRELPPVAFRHLEVASTVRAGQAVPGTAWVSSAAPAEMTVRVDGVVASRHDVSPSAGPVAFELPPLVPGTHDVELALESGAGSASAFRMINVAGLAPALYVGDRAEIFGPALASTGRGLDAVSPAGLAARIGELDRYGVILLDDLALADLDGAAWRAIHNAVNDGGVGLIVLGGERSFAAGGYRHSALESLLPVISEPGTPAEPAAVLFALDLSGSMGREIAGRRRLDLALDGLANAMRLLADDDVSGVLGFDVSPRWLTPLAASDAGRGPMRLPEASGGTLLAPALRAGGDALAGIDASRRLLVLITDGYADDAGLALDAVRALPAGVEILALAVGEEADAAGLAALVAGRQGRVVAVDNVLDLPGTIHREVAAARAVVRRLPAGARAEPGTGLPAPAAAGWPGVAGYAVTRARDEARVHVSSDIGDPLVASWRPGAGRVFALPAGVGSWASRWTAGAGWSVLAGELLDAVALDQPVEGAWLEADAAAGALLFRLWLSPRADGAVAPVSARLRQPNGSVLEVALRPDSPGSYALAVDSPMPGPWQLAVPLARGTARHAVYVPSDPLDAPSAGASRPLDAWLDAGPVRRLAESPRLALSSVTGEQRARPALVGLAIAAWLLLLWGELRRGWPGGVAVARVPDATPEPTITRRAA